MYKGIKNNNWKIDVDNKEFMLQHMIRKQHSEFFDWQRLMKKIIKI
jgi:hypothetical protein